MRSDPTLGGKPTSTKMLTAITTPVTKIGYVEEKRAMLAAKAPNVLSIASSIKPTIFRTVPCFGATGPVPNIINTADPPPKAKSAVKTVPIDVTIPNVRMVVMGKVPNVANPTAAIALPHKTGQALLRQLG